MNPIFRDGRNRQSSLSAKSNYTTLMIKISGTLVALIYVLCLPQQLTAATSEIVAEQNSFVKVSILSKRIKQIKDKNLRELVMNFPDGAIARDGSNGRHRGIKKIVVNLADDKLLFTADDAPWNGSLRLAINSPGEDASFSVRFADEERIYPLPLEIIGNKNDLRLLIREEISRYARDAAYAEYGKIRRNQKEAMAALTMLIFSRALMIRGHQPHDGFDFCDLAHCQTYAGRKSAAAKFAHEFPWMINTDRIPGMLYFHARCGGHTLDSKVFGHAAGKQIGVKDWFIHDGTQLCGVKGDNWEASITSRDLFQLVSKPGDATIDVPFSLQYDQERLSIDLQAGDNHYLLSPEEFRLRINRMRGWNFLKSNNYRISVKKENGTQYFIFRGKGLGHGAGLCQAGALQLAALGYSRYEILGHYFPGIEFTQYNKTEQLTPPGYSYVMFSLITGEVQKYSNKEILVREIPPGSIFKLIVALYLAVEKPDVLNKYIYDCRHNDDPNIPVKCWIPEGHGKIKSSTALANSCNLYFASLYRVIDRGNFKKFFDKLCRQLRIKSKLPEIKDNTEFAHLLAGLDYRVRFTVIDLMTLVRLLSLAETNDIGLESFKREMTLESRTFILNALRETMLNGTATYVHKSTALLPETGNTYPKAPPFYPCEDIWGKTATMIAGTNKNTVYGIFLGGCGSKGVVAVLRNGNGQKTAKIAASQLF